MGRQVALYELSCMQTAARRDVYDSVIFRVH
jgi:hypothetical protein